MSEFLQLMVAPNLVSTLEPGYPWDFNRDTTGLTPIHTVKKVKRRSMMQLKTTLWQVYSTFVGAAANLPVSDSNPVVAGRAVALDYDSLTPLNVVLDQISETLKPEQWPTFIETTLSGKVRLVWLFEVEVKFFNAAYASEFVQVFIKSVQGDTLLAGYDPASAKVASRWTNGGQWQQIAEKPISADYLQGCLMEASKKKTLYGRQELSLDAIAAEVEKRWPGRWKGEFKLDATGVRFWDDTADNETGCQVKPEGMLYFTKGGGLVRWHELFGKDFMSASRMTEMGALARDFYYLSKTDKYMRKKGELWIVEDRHNFDEFLKTRCGMSGITPKGETASEINETCMFIKENRRLADSKYFLNEPYGVITYMNEQYFNETKLIFPTPEPGPSGGFDPNEDFPWLWYFLTNGFANSDDLPLDHLFAWSQSSIRSFLHHEPRPGQALFIVGPSNCGKTLLQQHVIGPMIGTPPMCALSPMAFLCGNTNFNNSFFRYSMLAVNDEDGPSNEKEKKAFTQNTKALIVNPFHTVRPMYKEEIVITGHPRYVHTSNDAAEDVRSLIEVTDGTKDKLMFFRMQEFPGVFPPQKELEATIKAQLPRLMYWLLNVYEPPQSVLDSNNRSGVRSYFDRDVLEMARRQAPAYNLEEVLGWWVRNGTYWMNPYKDSHGNQVMPTAWEGTPYDLRQEFGLSGMRKAEDEWSQQKLNAALERLARGGHGRVEYTNDVRKFRIVRLKEDGE